MSAQKPRTLEARGVGCVVRMVLMERFVERLFGLLLPAYHAVAFERCSSIHTLGMGCHIDVCFATKDGMVLKSVRSLAPGRLLSTPHAYWVFERRSEPEPWFQAGERVEVRLC